MTPNSPDIKPAIPPDEKLAGITPVDLRQAVQAGKGFTGVLGLLQNRQRHEHRGQYPFSAVVRGKPWLAAAWSMLMLSPMVLSACQASDGGGGNSAGGETTIGPDPGETGSRLMAYTDPGGENCLAWVDRADIPQAFCSTASLPSFQIDADRHTIGQEDMPVAMISIGAEKTPLLAIVAWPEAVPDPSRPGEEITVKPQFAEDGTVTVVSAEHGRPVYDWATMVPAYDPDGNKLSRVELDAGGQYWAVYSSAGGESKIPLMADIGRAGDGFAFANNRLVQIKNGVEKAVYDLNDLVTAPPEAISTPQVESTPAATIAVSMVEVVEQQTLALGTGTGGDSGNIDASGWVTRTLSSSVDSQFLLQLVQQEFSGMTEDDTATVSILTGESLQATETQTGDGTTIVFVNGVPVDVGIRMDGDLAGKQLIVDGVVINGRFAWSADYQAAIAPSADSTAYALLFPYALKPAGLPADASLSVVFIQDSEGNAKVFDIWQNDKGVVLATVPRELQLFRPDQGDEAGAVAEGNQVRWQFSKAIEGQEPLVTSFELYTTPDVSIELSPSTVTVEDIKNTIAGMDYKSPEELEKYQQLFYEIDTGDGRTAQVILSQPVLDALRASTGLPLTTPDAIAVALAANDTPLGKLIGYAQQNNLLASPDEYRQIRLIAFIDQTNNPGLFIIESSLHVDDFTPAFKSIPIALRIGTDGNIVENNIDLTTPDSPVPLTLRLTQEGLFRWDNGYEGTAYLDDAYQVVPYEPLERPLVYSGQELLSYVYDYVGNHNNHTISGDSLTFDQKELTSQLIYPASPPLFIPIGDGKNSFSQKQADEILGYLAFAYEHSAYLREIMPLARPQFIVKSPLKKGLFLSPAYYPNGVTGIRINTVNIEDRDPEDPASVFEWRKNAGPPGGLKGKMVATLLHESARCQTHHAEMDSGPKGVIYQRDLEWRLIQSMLPSLSQEDKDGAKYDFEFSHGIPFDDYTPSN